MFKDSSKPVEVRFQQDHFSTGKGNHRLKKNSILLKNDPGYFHDFLSQFSTLKKYPRVNIER